MINKSDVELTKYSLSDNSKSMIIFYTYKGEPKVVTFKKEGLLHATSRMSLVNGFSKEECKQIRDVLMSKIPIEDRRKLFLGGIFGK